jgi:hypothetical protein
VGTSGGAASFSADVNRTVGLVSSLGEITSECDIDNAPSLPPSLGNRHAVAGICGQRMSALGMARAVPQFTTRLGFPAESAMGGSAGGAARRPADDDTPSRGRLHANPRFAVSAAGVATGIGTLCPSSRSPCGGRTPRPPPPVRLPGGPGSFIPPLGPYTFIDPIRTRRGGRSGLDSRTAVLNWRVALWLWQTLARIQSMKTEPCLSSLQ